MNDEKPNLINITDEKDLTNEQLEHQLSSGKNESPEEIRKKKKRQKIVIISILSVLAFALLVTIIVKIYLDNRVTMYNGYTEEIGETLKIQEITTKLEIKTLGSIEKHVMTDENNKEYLKLKLSVKNKYKKETSLSSLSFNLVDKDKNVLASNIITLNKVRNDIGDMHFFKNEEKEGYIFFTTDGVAKNDNNKNNDAIIKNAKYLKVSVLSLKEETDNSNYNNKYEDYYLTIK